MIMTTSSYRLVGVRADGTLKALTEGLTQEQAQRIAALLGTTAFSRIVIEAIDHDRHEQCARPPRDDEQSTPWSS